MSTWHHAPSREENVAGVREFAYMAEVDILGWKFRMMKNGSFVIDTPIATEHNAGRNMLCILGRDHAALLSALLALDPDVPPALIPDRWDGVGRLVQ